MELFRPGAPAAVQRKRLPAPPADLTSTDDSPGGRAKGNQLERLARGVNELARMVRSFAFTTQGRLHTKDIDAFPDADAACRHEPVLVGGSRNPRRPRRHVLSGWGVSFPSALDRGLRHRGRRPKSRSTCPRRATASPYLFIVIHAVDYSRKDGVFATSELNFFLGKNFLVTYHVVPLKSVSVTSNAACAAVHIARAPDRVAHSSWTRWWTTWAGPRRTFDRDRDLESGCIAPTRNARLYYPDQEGSAASPPNHPARSAVLARFASGEFKLIRAHLVPYYRNVYDALHHISELAQSYTDSLTGILQVYLNMSSNQTGEVSKRYHHI